MNERRGYGGCWPTPEQESLLKACILTGDGAVDAFFSWKSSADIERVDPGSYRLFPLLYMNLLSHGVNDPLMNIFRWVYIRTRENNAALYRRLAALLKELNARVMPSMLIKGSALALLYYADPGLRPMMDADILVPTGRVREAISIITGLGWRSSITPLKGLSEMKLLSRLGWTPEERTVNDFSEEYFSVRHGQDFTNPDAFTIDLHWHLLHGYNRPDADSEFWSGASDIGVKGVHALALDPADQLLQVCAHGVVWNSVPPIRWVADAAAILNKEGEGLDWERLIDASKRHGKALQVRDALEYLDGFLESPVPGMVHQSLDSVPVSKEALFVYRVRTKKPGVLDGFVELRFLWGAYSKENGSRNLISKISGFPRFLEHVFGMSTVWHLIMYSGFELVRRSVIHISSVRDRILRSSDNG
jgi:hypothetical protein